MLPNPGTSPQLSDSRAAQFIISNEITQISLPEEASGVKQLADMFPHVSETCLVYLYRLSRGDLARVSDCVLSGPSASFISLLSSFVLASESGDRKLWIDADEQEGNDLAECVFGIL